MKRIVLLSVLLVMLMGAMSYCFAGSCNYGEPATPICMQARVISGAVGHHVVLMDASDSTNTGTVGGIAAGNIVYFSLIPSISGAITVSACSPFTNYDTVLEVLRKSGEFCDASSASIVSNDDDTSGECYVDCTTTHSASRVSFTAATGTEYIIKVGSYHNSQSCIQCLGLIVTIGTPCGEAPGNFICSLARELPGTSGTHVVNLDLNDISPPFPSETWTCEGNNLAIWVKFPPSST